jgi:putative transposase
MSDSYTSLLFHIVFSTHERKPLIAAPLQKKLWPYMGGIARDYKMKALAVGGIADHVHLLLSLPSTLAIAKAVQIIKANSSKWINEHPGQRSFAWQKSYGAFSIGVSQIETTVKYILNQEQHHAKMNFDEELGKILKRHGIEVFSGSDLG